MLRQIRSIRISILSLGLSLMIFNTFGQTGLNNGTRAVFIFDVAKYIDYGAGFADSSVFRIGILDKTSELFWEMGNLAKTRKTIQDKPVQLVVFRSEDQILHTLSLIHISE